MSDSLTQLSVLLHHYQCWYDIDVWCPHSALCSATSHCWYDIDVWCPHSALCFFCYITIRHQMWMSDAHTQLSVSSATSLSDIRCGCLMPSLRSLFCHITVLIWHRCLMPSLSSLFVLLHHNVGTWYQRHNPIYLAQSLHRLLHPV